MKRSFIKPMSANPGGEIAPEDVVGREALIDGIWRALRNQSVVMVAERRVGKTTVVKKMRHEPSDGIHVIYRDVEGLRTPLDFAEAVANDVERHLPAGRQGVAKLRKLISQLGGMEVAGVLKFPQGTDHHWRIVLETAIQDLVDGDSDTTYLFVWDELPLLLEKVATAVHERTAMDMLDALRGLRQAHRNLRMVYTGSVGLHHVLSGLRVVGYANDPTNDMRTVEVGGLDPEDGQHLAHALLLGERLKCSKPETIAAAISQAVDHVPFYIHQVVARMQDRGNVASEDLADSIVRNALVDAQDAWHLRHFRERLDGRYGNDRMPVVLAVLDRIAEAEAPLGFGDVAKAVRATFPSHRAETDFTRHVLAGDDENLRTILTLLQRDHYLRRDATSGGFAFRFSLIKRWWMAQQIT